MTTKRLQDCQRTDFVEVMIKNKGNLITLQVSIYRKTRTAGWSNSDSTSRFFPDPAIDHPSLYYMNTENLLPDSSSYFSDKKNISPMPSPINWQAHK